MSNDPQSTITLRKVADADLAVFYEHQAEPDGATVADFPSRDWDAHMVHWHKILTDDTVITRAVVAQNTVVGNIVSWNQDDHREVGFWIGKAHWGQGIATAALSRFLDVETTRPLFARVAAQNVGSIRVLEKNGFVVARALTDGTELVLKPKT